MKRRRAQAALQQVMQLDIPTLLFAVALCFGLLVIELSVATHGLLRGSREMREWTQGSWLVLLGLLALLLRPGFPESLSVAITNLAILAGQSRFATAIHRFLNDGADPPASVAWLFGAAALAVFVVLGEPYATRVLVISLAVGLCYLPMLWSLATRGRRREASLRSMLLALVFAMLSLFARAVHVLLAPGEYGGPFQPSLGQSLVLLSCLAGPLGAGFGFVLANFERVARRMEEQASHDALTGCLNRGAADALIEHALQRGQRERSPLALVLMDLDHFKQINDQHGHRMGDEALRRFAEVVRSRLRASDVFVRMGGEEFALLLPGTDAPGARRLAEEVRLAVQAMPLQLLHDLPAQDPRPQGAAQVTVSLGIAVSAADHMLTAESLYSRADEALYRAKRGGRNRVECAPALMQQVGTWAAEN